ncbi:LysR family transcriptional regulator [Micromonospora sp. 067-2]|uniref:LysR family transcriptional regulator n=1 Tax=Micromonospora sp. 067-2 TaxID=2789270 RepID=UPI00397A2F46
MNWTDLLAFKVLTEERRFTGAATRLGISQPALSVRIGRLERSLSARLVDRTPRGAVPTPAGQALAGWVTATQRGWNELQLELAEFGDAARTPPTTVRIAVSRLPGSHVVDELGRHQPGVDWRLRTVADPATVSEWLRLGDVEFGLWCSWPHTPQVDLTGLRVLAVRQSTLTVALAATHRLAGVPLIELTDLAEEEWVASVDSEVRDALRRTCRQLGGFSPVIGHVTDDRTQAAALVAAGRAVSLEVTTAPAAAGVVRRPVRDAPPATVLLAWRPDAGPERLVRDVLRALADDSGQEATAGVSQAPAATGERSTGAVGPAREQQEQTR